MRGCGWPPIWRSTDKGSTRRRHWGCRVSPRASFPGHSTSPGRRRSTSTIPRERSGFWPRPGTPMASTGGTLFSDVLYAPVAETIANYFRPVGIRMVLQPIERAGFFKAVQEKRLKNVILIGSGALGNAATRLEAWVAPGGTYVYGSYPDIEGLWREVATTPEQKSRGVLLERIQ